MVMTVKDAIDSAKGTLWAVLAWVDKERTNYLKPNGKSGKG